MLLLTDLLKCCCALCETSLFPHHCICKVLNIVPKLSPLFSVSHKCLAEVSLSNVIFSLFSRLPEAPQAVIKQRQEVPRPQARVRAPRAHPPAQGGAPSPCALQAPQLGQPPHPATIRNQHTWTNYGTPSHIQGLSKSTTPKSCTSTDSLDLLRRQLHSDHLQVMALRRLGSVWQTIVQIYYIS